MPTASDVLRIAAAEIGTTENPAGSNRNKYSLALGRPAEPWCADFLVWVTRQAGLRLPSEHPYTPYMATGFKRAGTWGDRTAGIAPGDVVFFNFGSGIIRHVGIVEAVRRTEIVTIEGNTSPGSAGSQDNGGGVYRRTRPFHHVVGYGRPAYTKEAAVPEAAAPAPAPNYAVNEEPVGLSAVFDSAGNVKGYYIICRDGGVFGFGQVPYLGRVHKRS